MICLLIFPIVFLLNLDYNYRQILASISFAIATISTITILFLPKTLILISGGDIDNKLGVTSSNNKYATSSTISPENSIQVLSASEAAKTGSIESRILVCREQVQLWQKLLLQLEEKNTSSLDNVSNSISKQSINNDETPNIEA